MIKTWIKYIISETAIDTFFKNLMMNFKSHAVNREFRKQQSYSMITTRIEYYEFDEPRYVYTTYTNCVVCDIGSGWVEITFTGTNGYDCKRDGTDRCDYPINDGSMIRTRYISTEDITDVRV